MMNTLLQKLTTNKIITNSYFIAYILGAILTLAFAPFGILPAVIIAFTGLLFLLDRYRKKSKLFWIGWFFGFGHFMTSLYWFSHALLSDPTQFGWMIPFALTLIPAVLGIYTGLVTYLLSFFNNSKVERMLAFISLWVIVEMLRTNFIIPFSWNLLGFAITASNTLLQFSTIAGVYGCSLLLAFVGSFLYTKNSCVIKVAIVLACFVWGYGNYKLIDKKSDTHTDFKIRLVQPSILEHPMGNRLKQNSALQKLVELSILHQDPKLKYIIWPEAAFPFGFRDYTNLNHIAQIAPKNGAIVFGSDRIIENLDKYTFYNSLIAISSEGQLIAVYDKEKLVPFGEYIPFKNFIPFVHKVTHGAEDFSSGLNPTNTIKIEGLPPFLPLICYETIFPNLNINGAEWILNVTNDAWFGKSIGPHQHFAMAKFRAAEYGIPVIRSANNGISAVISPYGEVLESLGTNNVGFMDIKLPKPLIKNKIESIIYKIVNNLVFAILLLVILFRIRHTNFFKK